MLMLNPVISLTSLPKGPTFDPSFTEIGPSTSIMCGGGKVHGETVEKGGREGRGEAGVEPQATMMSQRRTQVVWRGGVGSVTLVVRMQRLLEKQRVHQEKLAVVAMAGSLRQEVLGRGEDEEQGAGADQGGQLVKDCKAEPGGTGEIRCIVMRVTSPPAWEGNVMKCRVECRGLKGGAKLHDGPAFSSSANAEWCPAVAFLQSKGLAQSLVLDVDSVFTVHRPWHELQLPGFACPVVLVFCATSGAISS